MTRATGGSPRRLNRLVDALGARTYLEIGVAAGTTFRQVTAAERTGVDPAFQFDTASLVDRDTALHAQSSDAFFTELAIDKVFDVIFLDGLHTFEQTYRDLCNCIMHLNRTSVILIDDTLPSDPYSAVGSLAQSLRRRRDAGLPGQVWHGDVYKVVPMVHDFHLAFDHRTITGTGNPQTLVWRSRAGWRTPRFESVEAITRMSYFDLLDHEDVLRCVPEDEAFAACVAALDVPARSRGSLGPGPQ